MLLIIPFDVSGTGVLKAYIVGFGPEKSAIVSKNRSWT
jgi:hypothetical protein